MKRYNLFLPVTINALSAVLLLCGGFIAFRHYPNNRLNVMEIAMPDPKQVSAQQEPGNYIINPLPELKYNDAAYFDRFGLSQDKILKDGYECNQTPYSKNLTILNIIIADNRKVYYYEVSNYHRKKRGKNLSFYSYFAIPNPKISINESNIRTCYLEQLPGLLYSFFQTRDCLYEGNENATVSFSICDEAKYSDFVFFFDQANVCRIPTYWTRPPRKDELEAIKNYEIKHPEDIKRLEASKAYMRNYMAGAKPGFYDESPKIENYKPQAKEQVFY